MKMLVGNFTNFPTTGEQVRKITYSDGSTAYVFKKTNKGVQNAPTRRQGFPCVNRSEPMTKASYKRTLNRYFERLRVSHFIKTELRVSHIAKLLDHKYTTVYFWVGKGRKDNKIVNSRDLYTYIKNHKNGRDIYGLLCPNKVRYQPSEKLLEIIKCKK